MEASDDRTVVFRLKKPFPQLPFVILRTGDAAFFGWPTNPAMEELRECWIESADETEQKRIAAEMQTNALADVIYIPLGRYALPAAWRANVSGILKMNLPIMWNISKP